MAWAACASVALMFLWPLALAPSLPRPFAPSLARHPSVVATCYMQSSSAAWLRRIETIGPPGPDAPAGLHEALRVVGESEFAQGVAAMAESGKYGVARVNAGIVATVDLSLGVRAPPSSPFLLFPHSPLFSCVPVTPTGLKPQKGFQFQFAQWRAGGLRMNARSLFFPPQKTSAV